MLRTFQLSNNTIDSLYYELMFYFEWSNRWADDGDLILNIKDASRFTTTLVMLKILFNVPISCSTYKDEKGFTRICYAKLGSHVFVKDDLINSKELRDGLWELAQIKDNKEE